MAEDLRNYNRQLQQVEGALLKDYENEELLKLKADLEELIELTQDFIKTQGGGDSQVSNIHGSSNDHDVQVSVLAADDEENSPNGERCMVNGRSEVQNGKEHSKEYLKKKKLKKQQRFQQFEDERETVKNNWLKFHTKVAKKPGVRTKSIFASPDNLDGRVGVGTCGISGKPMTEYTSGGKWKKVRKSPY